jgi:AcrR family transcriptional regulator
MSNTKSTSDARTRLLETADRLFYAEGFRAVGIDRVIAEANVAKATLYAHFPSKDDLILAVLKHREETSKKAFQEWMDEYLKHDKDPLLAFFFALKEWFQSPRFRGCVFINANVELADPNHPGSEFARGYKYRFTNFLKSLIEPILGEKAAQITPAVSLLVEGAIVTAVLQGTSDAADVAREAALNLIRQAERT